MNATLGAAPTDRLLALALAILVVATLTVGVKAHAFCSIFCVHGDRMAHSEICSARSAS